MTKITKKTNDVSPSSGGLSFTKMAGAGNDFLIFDARSEDFPDLNRSNFATKVCRRNFSIGADGVVFIEKPRAGGTLKWDFYNADGSSAEMCGNAARCVARYAYLNKITGSDAVIETVAGPVKTRVLANDTVEVEMPKPRIILPQVEVPVGEHGAKVSVLYVDTGVPHVVKENDDWDSDYLHEIGEYLRNYEFFEKTGGANVTFFEIESGSRVHSATYERGVEAVTLACGTGAVAAAVAAVRKGVKPPVTVIVPGGELTVNVDKDLTKAVLSGDARFICEGTLKAEALL